MFGRPPRERAAAPRRRPEAEPEARWAGGRRPHLQGERRDGAKNPVANPQLARGGAASHHGATAGFARGRRLRAQRGPGFPSVYPFLSTRLPCRDTRATGAAPHRRRAAGAREGGEGRKNRERRPPEVAAQHEREVAAEHGAGVALAHAAVDGVHARGLHAHQHLPTAAARAEAGRGARGRASLCFKQEWLPFPSKSGSPSRAD